MGEWLFVGLEGISGIPRASTRPQASRLQGLIVQCGNRIAETVPLRQWQKTAGVQRIPVIVKPVSADVADCGPGRIWLATAEESAFYGYCAELQIPNAWFNQPVDGIVAIKLLQGILACLDGIGHQYGLGPAPAAPPGKTSGSVPSEDPFGPPALSGERAASYLGLAEDLERQAIEAGTGRAICVWLVTDNARGEKRKAGLLKSLGTIRHRQVWPVAGTEVASIWTIEPRW